MEQTALSVPDQIRGALDGRTQRWLSLKIGMPESVLSNKMIGRDRFTDTEIKAISQLLKVKIR